MEGQWGWGNRGKARRKPHHILCSSFGREDKWVVVLKIPVPHPEAPADPWVTLWSWASTINHPMGVKRSFDLGSLLVLLSSFLWSSRRKMPGHLSVGAAWSLLWPESFFTVFDLVLRKIWCFVLLWVKHSIPFGDLPFFRLLRFHFQLFFSFCGINHFIFSSCILFLSAFLE